MLLSIVLTFVFLSANVLSTDFSKLFTRQPNSIVVHAKGFSSGGGFKSGSFSSGGLKSGGFKSGSFSSGSSSKSGASSQEASVPAEVCSEVQKFRQQKLQLRLRQYLYTYSILGMAQFTLQRCVSRRQHSRRLRKIYSFIVVVVVIYNIIKKSRRY